MAISFIADAFADSTTGAPSITHGLTLLENDVLIACIHVNGASTITSDSSAFTEQYTDGYTTASMEIHHRVCTGSDAATFSWSVSLEGRWGVVLKQFRGVDTTSIYDVAPAAGNRVEDVADTTVTAPSITVVAGAMGVVAFAEDVNAANWVSVDNSYTDFIETTGSTQATMMANRLFASAGATGATTGTKSDGTFNAAGNQFSLLPATGTNETVYPFTGPWR